MYIDMRIDELDIEILDSVYRPEEDTFLMLDVLEGVNVKGMKCIDVCCGTGVIGLKLLLNGASLVLFTDINPVAVRNTMLNYRLNKEKIKGIATFSLGDCLEHVRLDRFNLIACNPPYLPVDEDIQWSGGEAEGGLKIVARIIDVIYKGKFSGKAFIVLSTLSDTVKFESIVEDKDLNWEIIAEKPFFYERIRVYMISR